MQYQKYLSYLILIISLNSCTTWHYTNYGKPFDFLKAQRVSCKIQETSSKDLVQPFPSMAKMESKKSNSNKTEKQYSIEERYTPKNRFIKENSFVLSQSTNHRLNEQKEVKLIKAKHKMMNALTEKVQHRIERELAKSSAIASLTNTQPEDKSEEITDFVLLLLCLILPPAAVWWVFDTNKEFWIDLMCFLPLFVFRTFGFSLLILYVIPVLYAIYVIFLA
tara:strand:- start:778 stop:1440 length:663 start_codon:yes stop_codon:yes gene_type:complete